MYLPIRDYAVIGNLRSAVLVSGDGSIDWAPAPFLDSPSVFAALLDDAKGGYFKISPAGEYKSTQYYLRDSNVLVTEFTTTEGVLTVTDVMPMKTGNLFVPEEQDTTFQIKRRVACTKGVCAVHVAFMPRFDYARGVTKLSSVHCGILAHNAGKRGMLITNRPFLIDEETNIAQCSFSLGAGEVEYFVFHYNIDVADVAEDNSAYHEAEVAQTVFFWQTWSAKCDVSTGGLDGPWRDELIRSALLLKLLVFEPTGTIAAAPTTSLPERIGGVRNWDYRYTWIRDSSFVLNSLMSLGQLDEAEKYLHWLIDICRQSKPSEIQIMYGLHGERELTEITLPHLHGYRGSQPVRIGNGAYQQHQWDIFGSIFDVVYKLYQGGGARLDTLDMHWGTLSEIADYVAHIWREPDEGLWEMRSGRRHFVHSKVMCWVALDRAVRLLQERGLSGNVALWERERDTIRDEVFRRGYNASLNSFTQCFDSTELDAALLLLPETGFIAGDDARMQGTIAAIVERLSCGDGLLKRYTCEDGLPGEEGAFLLASFWLVDAYVRAGHLDVAERLFERLLKLANHVGLYAEELDPKTGDFLGNFPQAYTHIGLINSALLLRACRVKTTLPAPLMRT